MRVLISLCVCKGEAVVSKQNAICDIFLNNETYKNNLVYGIYLDEDKIPYIQYTDNDRY